jgi:hypothetical protein
MPDSVIPIAFYSTPAFYNLQHRFEPVLGLSATKATPLPINSKNTRHHHPSLFAVREKALPSETETNGLCKILYGIAMQEYT